jgi:hypothetical protein
MPVILATWETEMERVLVQDQPGQIVLETTPISKITKAKWTGMVEHLLCKHESLSLHSLHSSPTKENRNKKEKKKKKERKEGSLF